MKRLLCSASLAALTAQSAAAETPYDLGVLVLSAGLSPTTTLQTGVSVDIITEEDLDDTGETRVIDFLARQPSVSIRANGPTGTQAGITIRGVGQNNIAVRIDGIDVSDPSGTQVAFDFGGLLTSDISRIEILRGPQSALYGSESIGGVIDIKTKRATKEGSSFQSAFEFGSYNTAKAALTYGYMGEGFETAVTLSSVTSDGYSAADEDAGNPEADGFWANRVSVNGSYVIGDGVTLSFSAFTEESEAQYDEFGPTDGTPDEVTHRDQRAVRVALAFQTGYLQSEISASRFLSDRVLTGTNAFGPFTFNYEGSRDTIGYLGTLETGGKSTLVFGLERTSEKLVTDFGFGASTYDTTVDSIFGEYTFAPNAYSDVSLAVRHDSHSQFGDFTTGRLSGVLRAREDLIFRANLANGYRAPSNYELFDPWSGDSTLQPETSVAADLSIEKLFSNGGFLRATAFWIQAEDIIDYSYTTYGYVQRPGSATRKGIEIAGSTYLSDGVHFDASYTYTESKADAALDSSGWLAIAPRHQFSATLRTAIGDKTDLSVTGLYEADRAGLDDYGIVNATVTRDLGKGIEGYIRVENLFDTEYQTAPGYGQSDRAWFVGARASF